MSRFINRSDKIRDGLARCNATVIITHSFARCTKWYKRPLSKSGIEHLGTSVVMKWALSMSWKRKPAHLILWSCRSEMLEIEKRNSGWRSIYWKRVSGQKREAQILKCTMAHWILQDRKGVVGTGLLKEWYGVTAIIYRASAMIVAICVKLAAIWDFSFSVNTSYICPNRVMQHN